LNVALPRFRSRRKNRRSPGRFRPGRSERAGGIEKGPGFLRGGGRTYRGPEVGGNKNQFRPGLGIPGKFRRNFLNRSLNQGFQRDFLNRSFNQGFQRDFFNRSLNQGLQRDFLNRSLNQGLLRDFLHRNFRGRGQLRRRGKGRLSKLRKLLPIGGGREAGGGVDFLKDQFRLRGRFRHPFRLQEEGPGRQGPKVYRRRRPGLNPGRGIAFFRGNRPGDKLRARGKGPILG
jgi:hypothetical protein